jgi:hypothetical protein
MRTKFSIIRKGLMHMPVRVFADEERKRLWARMLEAGIQHHL